MRFDEDGNGHISRQELFNALSDPALGVDPKEIDEIIDQVDADGSGTIDVSGGACPHQRGAEGRAGGQ